MRAPSASTNACIRRQARRRALGALDHALESQPAPMRDQRRSRVHASFCLGWYASSDRRVCFIVATKVGSISVLPQRQPSALTAGARHALRPRIKCSRCSSQVPIFVGDQLRCIDGVDVGTLDLDRQGEGLAIVAATHVASGITVTQRGGSWVSVPRATLCRPARAAMRHAALLALANAAGLRARMGGPPPVSLRTRGS